MCSVSFHIVGVEDITLQHATSCETEFKMSVVFESGREPGLKPEAFGSEKMRGIVNVKVK